MSKMNNECTVFTRKKERQNYIVYSCIFSVWTQIYSYIYSGRNLHSFVQNNHIHYWWTWKISWTFVCYSVSMQLYQYCHFTFTCRVSLHFYKSFVLSSFFLFFFFKFETFAKISFLYVFVLCILLAMRGEKLAKTQIFYCTYGSSFCRPGVKFWPSWN